MRDELKVEDQRHIAKQLSEEELAIFDLLIQPDIVLSENDKAEVNVPAGSYTTLVKQRALALKEIDKE